MEDQHGDQTPGSTPDNPVNIDTEEAPIYANGSVAGTPLDLAEGEDDTTCLICLEVRHEGLLCNKVQQCCRAQSHRACYFPWMKAQQERFHSVSCPNCRVIDLETVT